DEHDVSLRMHGDAVGRKFDELAIAGFALAQRELRTLVLGDVGERSRDAGRRAVDELTPAGAAYPADLAVLGEDAELDRLASALAGARSRGFWLPREAVRCESCSPRARQTARAPARRLPNRSGCRCTR